MLLPSGLSTTNYAVRASSKGWGKGWTLGADNCDAVYDCVVVETANGARISMRTGIAELVDILLEEIERRGYYAVKGWCWGYSCRAIAGTSTPSNHSWGLALDLNAPTNPYTYTGQHDIPDYVFALFRAYGFGVGADYTGKKDWMHIEFMGTPGDASIMTALARRAFRAVVVNPPATPPNTDGWPLPEGHFFGPGNSGPMHNGSNSQAERDYVAEFQDQLRLLGYLPSIPDGIFGSKTAAATGEWQARNIGGQVPVVSRLCGANDWYAIHASEYRNPALPSVPVAPVYPGKVLETGSTGNSVRVLQERLNDHLKGQGKAEILVDGDFGSATKTAVAWFQYAHGGLGVDGRVGAATWKALWK